MTTRYSLLKARDEVIYYVIEVLAAEKANEIRHGADSLAHLEMTNDYLDKALRNYTLTAFDLATGEGEK